MQEHVPVLLKETIAVLNPQSNQNFIDATVGFGGHSREILKKTTPRGRLLAIDQDPVAISVAKKNLKNYIKRVDFAEKNFDELGLIIRDWCVDTVDGILFDLGVSTYQLQSTRRGFSFLGDSPLDMRMSSKTIKTAADVVNKSSFQELKRILQGYGEEPFAGKIASEIIKKRVDKPIMRTGELVEIIGQAIPERFKTGKIHFATKTFQALRIVVNDEIDALENGLKQALQVLSPGGRIAVISFHSLEDRIVKRFFKENNLQILTNKPIVASEEEIQVNPKARSAKLRAAIKIS